MLFCLPLSPSSSSSPDVSLSSVHLPKHRKGHWLWPWIIFLKSWLFFPPEKINVWLLILYFSLLVRAGVWEMSLSYDCCLLWVWFWACLLGNYRAENRIVLWAVNSPALMLMLYSTAAVPFLLHYQKSDQCLPRVKPVVWLFSALLIWFQLFQLYLLRHEMQYGSFS